MFDDLFGAEAEAEEEELKTVTDVYARKRSGADPEQITVHLIASHHSLWGNKLWNASIVLADLYDEPDFELEGKHVLEVGAGAGLPGLICGLNGAARTVISDYGSDCDRSLVEVIQMNVDILADRFPDGSQVEALPYIWGNDVQPLLAGKADGETEGGTPGRLFDLIVIADCLFNRSEHSKLLKTCKECMAKGGTAWISFSHHDPEKALLDLNFYKLAVEAPFHFKVTKVRQWQLVDLFVCEDGMDQARGVVYLYHLQHTDDHEEALRSLDCVHEAPEVPEHVKKSQTKSDS